jgi:hypothetical protein
MASDEMTPAQSRRLQLWRAMTDLARAQDDGRLTREQVRLLEGLADSLQKLAGQLTLLANLSEQCVTLLDDAPNSASSPEH